MDKFKITTHIIKFNLREIIESIEREALTLVFDNLVIVKLKLTHSCFNGNI